MILKNSVGKVGVNFISDVRLVQELLNRTRKIPFRLLKVDGIAGAKTQLAIASFQKEMVGLREQDGRVDPNGQTWDYLKRHLVEPNDLQKSINKLFPNNDQNNLVPTPRFPKERKIAWGRKVTAAFKIKIIEICEYLVVSPDFMMSCIAFESGETFSSSIKNAAGSGATGLIQFMPSTAKALGTTVEQLAKMTPIEQLDYVKKYFSPYRNKLKSLEDIYMAILYPSAIGSPSDHVLFEKGKKTYEQNSGFDSNEDGKITIQEVSVVVRQKYEVGLKKGYLG